MYFAPAFVESLIDAIVGITSLSKSALEGFHVSSLFSSGPTSRPSASVSPSTLIDCCRKKVRVAIALGPMKTVITQHSVCSAGGREAVIYQFVREESSANRFS